MPGGKYHVLCGRKYCPCGYYCATMLQHTEDFYYLDEKLCQRLSVQGITGFPNHVHVHFHAMPMRKLRLEVHVFSLG